MADEERITVEIDARQLGPLRGLLAGALVLLALNLGGVVALLVTQRAAAGQATAGLDRTARGVERVASNMAPATGWEYRTEFFREGSVDSGMNRMGTDGWEAIATRRASTGGTGFDAQWGAEVTFRRAKH
jgi:hypothetical protein